MCKASASAALIIRRGFLLWVVKHLLAINLYIMGVEIFRSLMSVSKKHIHLKRSCGIYVVF